MFLQGGNALDFFYCASSVNIFYAMFDIIFMNFDIILVSFWGHFDVILVSLGALGPPRGPKRFRSRFLFHFGSILGCLWEPLGHPSGSLFGPFGRPEGPRSEKSDALEGVCSQAPFLIRFSSLFGCLGPLKPPIPYGRGIQNRSFDRDRKNYDFGPILAWFWGPFRAMLGPFGSLLPPESYFSTIFFAPLFLSFFYGF